MCLFIDLSFLPSIVFITFLGSVIDFVNKNVLKSLFLPVAENYIPIFGA